MRQRYQQLETLNQQAHKRLRSASCDTQAFAQMYDIGWIYHDNALEGCVLSYPEIRSAVDNQVISDVSLMPTYRDIKAQKHCMDAMRGKAEATAVVPGQHVDWLVGLHKHLLGSASTGGQFRRDMPIHRTYFHPIAPPDQIAAQLDDIVREVDGGCDYDLHPVELAARVHHRFMRAFPFSQHSGLLGRLLMNLVLVREHFLPSIIHASDRQRYYEALRGEEPEFVAFLAETLGNSLHHALRLIEAMAPASRRAAL